MKKIRIMLISAMLIMLLAVSASASETLAAGIEGNRLVVSWSVECDGEAVLSVYKDSWPIEIRRVDCADGAAEIWLDRPSGTYSVKLRTGEGCLAAGMTVAGEGAQADPTRTPAVEATLAPASAIVHTPAPTAIATKRPASASGSFNSGLAGQVVEQVNAERAKYGLSALRVDSELTRAAQIRAAEIVSKFSHTRSDGSKWSTVSASAYGENIAKGQKTADKVMAAWLTSEGHRANILKKSYGSIGICAYVSGGITYWVQLFGK